MDTFVNILYVFLGKIHSSVFIYNQCVEWKFFIQLIKACLLLIALFLCFSSASCAGIIPESALPVSSPAAAKSTFLPSNTVIAATLKPSVTPSALPTQTHTLFSPPTETATSEPAGCLEPPDDYTRIQLSNATLNARTYAMLQHAAELYSGEIDILNAITQGSYTDAEAASFGTHSGGGAVDLSVMRSGTYTILWDEIDPLIYALRTAGFAAWLRDLDALYPGSPIHIHAVAIGDKELSYMAQMQVYGDFGYFAGMDGLPPSAGEEPNPDPHGGALICDWMLVYLEE